MNKITLCMVRVSTDAQKTALQLAAVTAECQRLGLRIIPLERYRALAGEYGPQGSFAVLCEWKASGQRTDAEPYTWALGQIKGGWVAKVITYRADRLGRSQIANLNFAKACMERDVSLVSLRENIDLTTPSGRFQFNIISACAEYERELISERVKDAIAERKARGLPHGGTAKGWTFKRVAKLLPRVYELLDMEWSLYHIRAVTGLNYRTLRKYRDLRGTPTKTRKQLNTEVYGRSEAKV